VDRGGDIERASNYRNCQILSVLLNDGFCYYIATFPSLLVTISCLLAFAAIRYFGVPFMDYVIFPACGLRCFLESLSALGAAGMAHQGSVNYLRRQSELFPFLNHNSKARVLESQIQKSWRPIQMKCASMYTFEKSIVITTLDTCNQVLFTLLVTY